MWRAVPVERRVERRLERADVDGLGALVAGLGVEAHAGALGQGAEALRVDARVVDEEVLARVVRRDEAEALVVVERLDGSGGHSLIPPGISVLRSRRTQRGNDAERWHSFTGYAPGQSPANAAQNSDAERSLRPDLTPRRASRCKGVARRVRERRQCPRRAERGRPARARRLERPALGGRRAGYQMVKLPGAATDGRGAGLTTGYANW